MHGASTLGKTHSKDHLIDGAEIMHCLFPVFIDIMLKTSEDKWDIWGRVWYPRVLGVGIEEELYTNRDVPENLIPSR